MNDEEFYNCYTISKEQVDFMITEISVKLIYNILEKMTGPIKEAVREHPDNEQVKRSFKDISEYAKKKVYEETDKSLAEAMAYSFRNFDEIMKKEGGWKYNG